MMVGDVVCTLQGLDTPFLLRAVERKDGLGGDGALCFNLVGSCFIHGLMYGESSDMGQMVIFNSFDATENSNCMLLRIHFQCI